MTRWLIQMDGVDRRILWTMAGARRAGLTRFMRGVTHVGDPFPAVATTLLLMSGLLPALQAAGEVAALALIISHCASQILKRAVCRSRPVFPDGTGSLIGAPDCFSFPSGHASAALSVGLPVFLVLPPTVGVPALVLALLVGVSRCYLGVHYPGDVLVGWCLAAASVALVS